MITSRSRLGLIALSLLLIVSSTPVSAKGRVYEPPYKEGPSGGDEFNRIEADPETGEMTIYRLFPGISPVVGCEPEPDAGWASFRIDKVRGPFRTVVTTFNAELDTYSWASIGVRTKSGDWFGVAKMQGPYQGEAELKLNLPNNVGGNQDLSIEFGLQLGDACPQVGYAHATFNSVEVR